MKTGKKYRWTVVGLLAVVALLNYLDRQMLSTLRPAMQKDIPELQSATDFGYLMSVFLWVYGCMSPVAGIIADRVNRKWLIVLSLLVWSAVVFTMGYAESYRQLYWLRAVMGVSEALYLPAALSLIADFHGSGSRSLAIGLHMTGLYLGQALGGFGATMAAHVSWQSTFHVFGLGGVLYAGLLAVLLREPEGVEAKRSAGPGKRGSLRALAGNTAFWVILIYFMVLSLPGWAAKNWLPTLFAGSLHLDMAQAGPLSTITVAVAAFAGVLLGGSLADRWVQRDVRGRIYTSVMGLGLMAPSLLLIGFGHTILTVGGAALGLGIGLGVFDANNMPILCQFVGARSRATAYGLMNMAGVFAGALVTDMLGRSTDAGHLGRDFSIMAGVVVIAMGMQLFFLKPQFNNFPDEGQRV